MIIGIVAGEVSGDTLGAALIRALRVHYPQARFVGICGTQMQDEGGESWFPMERLSVMGLVEVLGRIQELFQIRDTLVERFISTGIDLFIGIDAPDFNLRLAPQLKAAGIPTVHYVSPSVWAWRQGRVRKIAASIDLMLCLLPFEKQFYDTHGVHAVFVGHPLADSLPLVNDTAAARRTLGLSEQGRYIALLPGSRGGEVSRIGPVLFAAGEQLAQRYPDARFLIPAINAVRRQQINDLLAATRLQAEVFDASLGSGVGRLVMAAADVVVLASGTATLEAMLLQKPMVVAYRLHWLTYWLGRLLVRSPFFSLPNLLAGQALVPELLQGQANPRRITTETARWLDETAYREQTVQQFTALHRQLQADGSRVAADAIHALLAKPRAVVIQD